MKIFGKYYDGEKAIAHSAQVIEVSEHRIVIRGIENLDIKEDWPMDKVVVDECGHGLMRIHLDGKSPNFVTHDARGIKVLKRLLLGKGSGVDKQVILLSLAAVLAILISVTWLSVDPISKGIAKKIPFKWEKKISSQYRSSMMEKTCGDEKVEKILAGLSKKLLGQSQLKVDFDIRVIPKESINAFALPGGLILLHEGLIKAADSAEEVAGVLAHEMQHVIQRHITAHIVRSGLLSSIWQFTVGNYSGVLVFDPHTIYQLASLKFSREAETSADIGAVNMLKSSRIGTAGFAKFFKRLHEKHGDGLELLSTHPQSSKREDILAQSDSGYQKVKALNPENWQFLQDACK